MSGSKLFDLRSQLRFYKLYHHNATNVLIHSIFVPTILFSSIAILNNIKFSNGVTLGHLVSIGYGIFYVILNIPAGILASVILLLANMALDRKWIHMTNLRSFSLFGIGWLFQFMGHGIFEKRKPALMDNLVQSLVLAPYFILFEFLFKLGFMPELEYQLNQDIKNKK